MRFTQTHSLHLAETLQGSGEITPSSLLVAEPLDRLTRNRPDQALTLLQNIAQRGVKNGFTAQSVILDLASCAVFFPILANTMRLAQVPSARCAAETR
ncbi:MAG TPA: hypothetical protein VN419_13145 [Humidesulfovibrio sp.]|uniref:hypothetical protein n=1 Tax=Humidesulfovibrio sp. TaxID=2910988 RepID=UPI002B773C5D|nr:hypothetical protein [Humidesulfovibrio sp.]HWR04944.1 hypothetical protein [Humidesulfovibrio sp.]